MASEASEASASVQPSAASCDRYGVMAVMAPSLVGMTTGTRCSRTKLTTAAAKASAPAATSGRTRLWAA